ncbi:hypothetical protein DNTS_024115, partial [Danionella cerebrum]
RDGCVKETRALSQPSSSVIHLHDTAPKRRTFPKCPALVRQMEGVEREAGRLLVIPAFGSHWSGMKPLVEELGRRGHEVVVVFPEENPKLKPAKHATTIRYPVTYTNDEMEKNMEVGLDKMLNVDVSTNLAKFVSFYITLDLLNVVITRNAESLMTNDDLMKKLQSYNFDAILTDPFETVGIIASEYLSIPTIYMQTSHPCGVDALVTQCPAPPSYVPQGLTHFTNNMDLWQRSINFLRSLYQPQACRRMFNRADEIASHVLQKKITAKEILSRAALWFMHFDFAFELPRPLMPNMVLIGGVDTKKAEPLSQKLDYKTSLKQRVDSEPQNSLAHKPSTHLCIDRMAASLLLSCFFCLGLAEAGKLLVLPSDGSHWTGMRPLVEELGKKGHEVVVVIPEASLSMGPSQHTTTLTYPVPYTKTQLLEQVNAGVSTLISAPVSTDLARFQSYMNTMDLLSVLTTRNVNGFFSEKDLMKKLRDYDFDAILTDPFEPIGVIASEFLSLPAIYVQSGHPCSADALAAQRPAPPSYVPHGFTFFTDRMNLWQRSVNFIRTLLQPMACGRMFVHADEIATRVLQRKTSMLEILTRAALWFELEEFVNGSGDDGFVVFTLGSMVSQLPEAKAREFFEAFRQIPQRVLWRYTGKVPEDAPKNVKLMKWLPQNDLLGHAKVKAFITHGGSHGIYEGICNGVPMVMLPLFGDQGDNVQRLVSRGVAESLSIYDVTSEKLLVALRKVINDKSYKEKMTKLSSIHRDRPIEPLDLAVFWTEFVMRHKGAAHLRPAAHELNWIQYHSLDVIGFLLLILVTVVFVSVKSCMFCFRKCVKRIQKKKKE